MASPPATATAAGLNISTPCRSTRFCPREKRGFHSSKLYSGSSITFLSQTSSFLTICTKHRNHNCQLYLICSLPSAVFSPYYVVCITVSGSRKIGLVFDLRPAAGKHAPQISGTSVSMPMSSVYLPTRL